jgi:peptidoglycan/LPS O-acetylase OafA/YrhL
MTFSIGRKFKSMKQRHIPGLDGLRGIACLLIFLGHFVTQNKVLLPPTLADIFSQFWSGVDFFFVLSGFVIFLSLNNLRENGIAGLPLFRSFFVSRAFRILPPYILLLLAFYFIPFHNKLINSVIFTSAIPIYVFYFFGQSWYIISHHCPLPPFLIVSWSLCAEVFLYILSFLIVLCLPSRFWVKILVGMVAISYGFRLDIILAHQNLIAAYDLPNCRMDGFMIGGIVALLYARGQLKINQRLLDWFILTMLAGFVALSINDLPFLARFSILFSYLYYSMFFSAILIKVIGTSYHILSLGPIKYIGTVSYCFYLFHFPIVYGMSTLNLNVFVNLILSLGSIVGLATLSWFWMEKPMINRGMALRAHAQLSRQVFKW